MLRIANMPRGLQYTLSQDGIALFIHMERDFARDVAVEIEKIAYNARSKVTSLIDIQTLGDFIRYKDGRPWGYGHCMLVEPNGDEESWKVVMPPWKSSRLELEAIQAQLQALLTLEAVFAAINVPNERYEHRERQQRVEVDLSYDARSSALFLKAEVSKRAIDCLDRFTMDEFRYIRETMSLAVENVLPLGENPYAHRMVCGYSSEIPLRFSMGDADFAATQLGQGGGCYLSTEGELTVHQVFTLLAGLAAFDELLEDFLSPMH